MIRLVLPAAALLVLGACAPETPSDEEKDGTQAALSDYVSESDLQQRIQDAEKVDEEARLAQAPRANSRSDSVSTLDVSAPPSIPLPAPPLLPLACKAHMWPPVLPLAPVVSALPLQHSLLFRLPPDALQLIMGQR